MRIKWWWKEWQHGKTPQGLIDALIIACVILLSLAFHLGMENQRLKKELAKRPTACSSP